MPAKSLFKSFVILTFAMQLAGCGTSDDENIVQAAKQITPVAAKPAKPSTTPPSAQTTQVTRLNQLTFTDAKLAGCIEAQAKRQGWQTSEQVTGLDCSNKSINSLGGIQHLTSLKQLDLAQNTITNLLPLANLTKLESLNLAGNALVNIEALSALNSLKHLHLGIAGQLDTSINRIRDIQALSGLSKLTELDLSGNQINDISVLANMPHLARLNLDGNQVRDIDVLFNLFDAEQLVLDDNDNIQCASLNRLETELPGSHVTRPTDCIFSLDILIADITFADPGLKTCVLDSASLEGWMTLSEMTWLNCDNQQIRSLAGLNHFKALDFLDLHNNQIMDISPLFELAALSTIDLSGNPDIACTRLDALAAVHGNEVINRPDSCSRLTLLSDLNFVDPVLEACVQYTAQSYQWTTIAQMTHLSCDNSAQGQITDLRGIDTLHALSSIDMAGHLSDQIRADDWQALAHLKQLTALDVGDLTLSCTNIETIQNRLGADVRHGGNCH